MDKIVHIGDHYLYVEVHGVADNYPIVLLHHGLGSTKSWNTQINSLLEAGYLIIVYDRWGYGKSDKRIEFSMPNFRDDVRDLHRLINKLGITNATLIGHSDGGTISLYFAEKYQHLISSVIAVSAHIYVEEKMKLGIERIHKYYISDPNFRVGLQRLHGEYSEQIFDNWYNGWKNVDNEVWDMRPIIKNIICPTLVIQGLLDEHATPQHAHDICGAIPGADLWLVNGGNHMVPQEMPADFNEKVISFLDGVYNRKK